MSVSRIKSIVIAALVLVNAFFLTIIIINAYADAMDERQAIENICTIFQSNGIEIIPESVKTAGAIMAMRTSREVELEANIANALLGQVDMKDQGFIYLYENAERGTAEFHSGGDFEIRLYEGIITYADDPVKTVRGLLKNMKLDASVSTISDAPDNETITVVNKYKGTSILNCTIDFIFNGNSLRIVRGRYVTGIEPAVDGAEISLMGTALLKFLAALKNGDIAYERITGVQPGYWYSDVSSFGEGAITPIWFVTTDSGQYIIDSALGEIRAV